LTTHYATLAGVKRVRFHELRHTHTTILLEIGESPKFVSERLAMLMCQLLWISIVMLHQIYRLQSAENF